eukprot:SAG11_NODE_12_length_27025_cov_37.402681_21_plen_232_part_00
MRSFYGKKRNDECILMALSLPQDVRRPFSHILARSRVPAWCTRAIATSGKLAKLRQQSIFLAGRGTSGQGGATSPPRAAAAASSDAKADAVREQLRLMDAAVATVRSRDSEDGPGAGVGAAEEYSDNSASSEEDEGGAGVGRWKAAGQAILRVRLVSRAATAASKNPAIAVARRAFVMETDGGEQVCLSQFGPAFSTDGRSCQISTACRVTVPALDGTLTGADDSNDVLTD